MPDIFIPGIPVPQWAWGIPKGSILAHVNRRYHWHMGALRALATRADVMKGRTHREAVQRIIYAEMRDVTEQFNAWKEAYAASRT